MSFNVSIEVEARIAANAQRVGVSIQDYLEQVLDETEGFAADVRRIDASRPSISTQQMQAKISRGLGQLERGELVSGEEFMSDLLARIDEKTRARG